MAKYRAICVFNWDNNNPIDCDKFDYEFGDDELVTGLANGDMKTWLFTMLNIGKGISITDRLSESGADRINISIERIKDNTQKSIENPSKSIGHYPKPNLLRDR